MNKYYNVNHERQTITVDTTVKPTKKEEADVKLFVSNGYKLRVKSQDRAQAMKDKADGLNADDIRNALKDDKKALDKFNAIVKGKDKEYKKGFFSAKKWYNEYTSNK